MEITAKDLGSTVLAMFPPRWIIFQGSMVEAVEKIAEQYQTISPSISWGAPPLIRISSQI